MACEEMALFYAYLDAVEEAKRKASLGVRGDVDPAGRWRAGCGRPGGERKARAATSSGFSCDEPE